MGWPTSWGPAPRFATRRNPERRTFGGATGKVADRLGSPLFAHQQYIDDVALEVDASGAWAYDDVVILMQRRAGKTFVIKAEVARRGSYLPTLMTMTAQNGLKARERWLEIADHDRKKGLMQSPMRHMLKCTAGTGNEILRWHTNGSEFRPFAPNDKAGHGDDPDMVVVDELWAFDLAEKRAIEAGYRPAWSVKPGQAWHLSAAGTSRSLWLKELRRRGREAVQDPGSRLAYFEW